MSTEPTWTHRAFWALFAFAVTLKAAYLIAYLQLPFLRGPIGDSTVYLAQAQAVRAGRFGDPTLLAFSPLYGYLLAAFSRPISLLLFQLTLGLGNLALLYWVLKPRFGAAAALFSACLYFGYGFLLFYETKVLTETLGLSLALWASLAFLSQGFSLGRWRCTLGTGVLVALAVLARASLIFGIPLFVLAALAPWTRTESWKPRLQRSTGLLLGVALILGGYGLWTKAHAGTFVLVLYVAPSTSILSHTTSQDWSHDLSNVARGGPSQVPSAWDVVDAVAADLKRLHHDAAITGSRPLEAMREIDVLGWLRGAPAKLWATMSDTEHTFQYGYYAEREHIAALRALPFGFHVLLIVGALGAFFLARRDGPRSLLPYLPWFLGCLVTTTLYHPSSRYRLAMIVPLLLLGGWGIQQLVRHARREHRWWFPAAVALLCGISIVRTATYTLKNPARWELTQASAWASQGNRERVLEHTERALRLAPDDLNVRRSSAHLRRALGIESLDGDAP